MSSAWSSSLRTHSCHARPPYDPPVAYDAVLAERIRALLPADAAISERAMFGGLAFLVGGHMAVAVSGRDGLMVRVDPADAEELIATSGAVPMEMRGRPLRGWLLVADDGLRAEPDLARWVGVGVGYVRTLPPKAQGSGIPDALG
jgi:TfoX/Sxy family transcriptional regulator of competence genes